jgi:hypothetical protein
MNIARRVLLLGCLLAVILPTIALSADQSEVIIVRKFQAERDGSASLIVDRVDYNQKGMTFNIAGDAGAKVFNFVKSSVGKKIRVTYTMEDGCDFCIHKAESISSKR